MKEYEGEDVKIQVFLTSALVRGEWSVSRPGRFNPRGKISRYLLNRRLGGPQNQSGRHGEEKILAPTGTRTPKLHIKNTRHRISECGSYC
jgi:hypothetical protein